jgi:hypothetical protein
MPTAAPRTSARAPASQAPKTASGPAEATAQGGSLALAPLTGSGAVALPADVLAELAADAKEAAAKERPSISRISLKSGVMSYGNQAIPGNQLDCVVIAGVFKNVYYSSRYDANNIVNPNCFALSEEEDELEAHANVPDDNVPEDDPKVPRETPRACRGCSMNAWSSDPNGGRGKACKETRRLLLLPLDALDSVANIKKAELAILDVPVTSVKNYGNFVNALATTINRPMWSVVTKVSVTPNARTQFQINFEPMSAVADAEILHAIKLRREDALRIALVPYDGVGGEADPEAAAPAKPQPAKKRKY